MNERRWSRRRWSNNFGMLKHVLVMFLGLLPSVLTLSLQQQSAGQKSSGSNVLTLNGDWSTSKSSLRHRDCCVTSVSGLERHVKVLQDVLADQGPADIDLRARIRVASSYEDCLKVRNSVVPLTKEELESDEKDPCSLALVELASGMVSLVDGTTLDGFVEDVFCRIVCASDYRARDPPYHTDKAPLRGYVTLCGVGTQFMTRPCSPAEYMNLRTFGQGEPTKSLRAAEQLEFIIMKGDYYDDYMVPSGAGLPSLLGNLWKRATACVHRSPPGTGGRRVIVSFDLADGDDDREWYQMGMKRQWRSGMTQRSRVSWHSVGFFKVLFWSEQPIARLTTIGGRQGPDTTADTVQ